MSGEAPRPALLLVDLQNDLLDRPGLVPDRDALCRRVETLIAAARRGGVPVVHVHTVTRADGSDRMPHWQRAGIWECVAGTSGVLPPPALAPVAGELVVAKRYFNAFGAPQLDPWLRERGIQRLIVAGIYLHACVRSTVLEAYERGYEIQVVDDAVGTTDPVHGELTRAYLAQRAAVFRPAAQVIGELDGHAPAIAGSHGEPLPVAVVAGTPYREERTRFVHRNPCRSAEVLAEVPLGTAVDIAMAVEAATGVQHGWAMESVSARAAALERWAHEIEARRPELIDLIVREVAKPRRFAEEEIGRAIAHVRIAAELVRDPVQSAISVAPGVRARQRALGVVGLVTPWNNPLAIPVGKIAPALAFGNAVVLKPAPQASAMALAILDSLDRGGFPPGVVNVVCGDAAAAHALCRHPRVAAMSVTGSVTTGRTVAALCVQSMKPLQAELGGNNAAIILPDADLEDVAAALVRAAFVFAGQRCTAIRRFVVDRSVVSRFEGLLRDATEALVNGDPDAASTEVGPLISAEKRDRVIAEVQRAVAQGARLVCGGSIPDTWAHGAWMTPALLTDVDRHSPIVQEEMFAPVAVILPANDLDDALAIANDVRHGLVLSVHTRDARARARVLEAGQAGIVQLASGPLAVHPRAPFLGWKASGLGPPEHGTWDAAFYARAQAVYGD